MGAAIKPWTTLRSTLLLDRPWLRVREEHVRLARGTEIEQFHVIEGPNWASVLALTEDRRAVLVRQYRHGLGAARLELPAGVIEPQEPPLAAAQRELAEETGYEATEWSPLISVSTEPSRHTTRAHFFVALGARLTRLPALDASEELEVELVERGALLEAVESGEIAHGVHIAAILLAERRGLLG